MNQGSAGDDPHASPTIILVEDNGADARLVKEAFIEINPKITVCHVRNGAELWETLPTLPTPADLILLDLNLAEQDGRELLTSIRAAEALTTIPVIVLSTSVAPKDVRFCYANGANAYLRKPVDMDRFVTMMATLEAFWLKTAITI